MGREYLATVAHQSAQGLRMQMPRRLAKCALGHWPGLLGAQGMIEKRIKLRLKAGTWGIEQKGHQSRQRQLAPANKRRGRCACLFGEGIRSEKFTEGAEDGMGLAMSWPFSMSTLHIRNFDITN